MYDCMAVARQLCWDNLKGWKRALKRYDADICGVYLMHC